MSTKSHGVDDLRVSTRPLTPVACSLCLRDADFDSDTAFRQQRLKAWQCVFSNPQLQRDPSRRLTLAGPF